MTNSGIPKEVAAQILFASDRTCCVCRIRGRPVQLHHIDEDNSNNNTVNIAVLCFDCHRDTQVVGGFDRKLDAYQIIEYRDDWIRRVQNRRSIDHGPKEVPSHLTDPLMKLIMSLPDRLIRSYRLAQSKWDTGVSASMHENNLDMIKVLKQMLVDLALFYPQSHFEGMKSEDYFHKKMENLFDWHAIRLDPEGRHGTVSFLVTVGGEVISELEKMVVDMVRSLMSNRTDFNFQSWFNEWKDHGASA